MNFNDNTAVHKNGFIISDTSFNVPNVRKPSSRMADRQHTLERNKALILESTKSAFDSYTLEAGRLNKSFFKIMFSTAVFILSIAFFVRFFTIGTVVFSEGKHIASATSEKAYESALSLAQKKSEGVKISEKLNCFPALLLRSKINSPTEISNRLLLTSPEFTVAYSLYSDGNAVYSATSEKEAEEVLLNYVNEYSMNGNAEVTSSVAIKKSVIKRDKLMEYSECLRVLKESNAVNVVSVVNSTVEESVPYSTQTEADNSLYIGETVTVTKGVEGKKEIFQKTIYKNGNEESSEIHSERIVAEPVSEVIKVGTKEKNILETGVIWPLSEKGTVSSRYGKRWGRIHEGLDIAIKENTPVLAAECGTVSYVSENAGGYGKYIKVSHGSGLETAYAHLNKIEVTKGQTVRAGEKIALSGNTGRSTGPHLHFEIIKAGEQIDPEPYIK